MKNTEHNYLLKNDLTADDTLLKTLLLGLLCGAGALLLGGALYLGPLLVLMLAFAGVKLTDCLLGAGCTALAGPLLVLMLAFAGVKLSARLLGATLMLGATLLFGAENPGIGGLDEEDADILGAEKELILELVCGLANMFCLLD